MASVAGFTLPSTRRPSYQTRHVVMFNKVGFLFQFVPIVLVSSVLLLVFRNKRSSPI